MNPFLRLGISTMALSAGFLMGIPASAAPVTPAPGLRGECGSAMNLAHVNRRLDGAIDRLQHDQSDYGGLREGAIDNLQKARGELQAAEQFATGDSQQGCQKAYGPTGGSDVNWGHRAQTQSNNNLWRVRRNVEGLIDQLQRDQRDYGGHRVAAISDMQAARAQLVQAEQYQKAHP